jgi:hypothetical protein
MSRVATNGYVWDLPRRRASAPTLHAAKWPASSSTKATRRLPPAHYRSRTGASASANAAQAPASDIGREPSVRRGRAAASALPRKARSRYPRSGQGDAALRPAHGSRPYRSRLERSRSRRHRRSMTERALPYRPAGRPDREKKLSTTSGSARYAASRIDHIFARHICWVAVACGRHCRTDCRARHASTTIANDRGRYGRIRVSLEDR